MRTGAPVVAAAAARFYAPLILLFAALVLIGATPGGGVGFVAGLAFGLALMLHALMFGVAAARTAFPTMLARLMLALGTATVLASAGLPGLASAPQAIEAGLFAATVGATAVVIQVVFGRAPTLRDEDI